MLWYKAWLDTRTRFLICLIAILGLSMLVEISGIRNQQTTLNEFFFQDLYRHTHMLHSFMLTIATRSIGPEQVGGCSVVSPPLPSECASSTSFPGINDTS